MIIDKEECIHVRDLLEKTKIALLIKDSIVLRELSDKTIHSACNYQDSASITISVLVYTLSKLVERNDFNKIKNWDYFIRKFNSILDLAIKAIASGNQEKYEKYIEMSRSLLESQVSLKKYIQDVLKKAVINKGSRIYEHGLSLEHTAKLLGTSQWELSEYIGQKNFDARQIQSIDIKKRAKMAMEFFS